MATVTALAPWEIALFALLLTLALTGFALRLLRVLRVILASKPDAGFTLNDVGRRMCNFFWQVLCQAKVIRERPLPGIAHAFVFWGFCAFALVTLNHVALGFGAPLVAWRGYFNVAAVFAMLVAVSIAGLAVRRLIVRPKWLGRVSLESVFIALLIFVLMITYLADYLLEPTGALWHAIWWTHTAALLIFLPLIPHTKHLHLLLSPVTIFLSRGSFSAIPPLVGDDDFGLVAGKDVTRILALQAFSCVECGRCSEHCPATNTGKLLNPKEIILGARAYLNESGPASEEPLLGKHISMEAAFQCTTCGACEYQCPVGIEHLPAIIGLRRGAVNTGAWDDEYGTKLFLNLERNGNPLGIATSERDKFLEKHEIPYFDGSQRYLLWMGCMGSYDPRGREILLSLILVLRKRRISFGVLKKERCSGDSARRLGNDLLFQTLAEQNMAQISESGGGKLLSICPHCVRTLGEDYKEFGASIDIEHHSTFLARELAELKPLDRGEEVTYHDACYLGRYQNIYDAPREIAALAGTLREPERSRERGFCCGAGGGMVFLGEEKGSRVNQARASQLVATGAGVVAAACPFCSTMLRDGLQAVAEHPPRLVDIAEIAAARLAD